MKDIFIDTNIAKNFTTPMDPHYKQLVEWIRKYDKQNDGEKKQCAFLAVSHKLLIEYHSSCKSCFRGTSIPVLIDLLTKEGRLNVISKVKIDNFIKEHFTKTIKKKLQSNKKDWNHIPVVLMSSRRYALTIDSNFAEDLSRISGFSAKVASKPQDFDYL